MILTDADELRKALLDASATLAEAEQSLMEERDRSAQLMRECDEARASLYAVAERQRERCSWVFAASFPRSDETLTEREAYLRARAAPLVTEGDK